MVYGLFSDKIHVEFYGYCGENEDTEEVARVVRGEPHLAYTIVLDLMADIYRKGHVISIDNFFTSVGLFQKLASRQIYAIDIV
jgi:hypothetical protein